jgi:hypothetical protein
VSKVVEVQKLWQRISEQGIELLLHRMRTRLYGKTLRTMLNIYGTAQKPEFHFHLDHMSKDFHHLQLLTI